MNALAQHLMLRLVDDRVTAPSLFSRRRLARCVLRLGRTAILLAFRLVDTHLHVLVKCDRRTAGELARRLEIALGQQLELPVPFAPAHIKPVHDQRHLRRLSVTSSAKKSTTECTSTPASRRATCPICWG